MYAILRTIARNEFVMAWEMGVQVDEVNHNDHDDSGEPLVKEIDTQRRMSTGLD